MNGSKMKDFPLYRTSSSQVETVNTYFCPQKDTQDQCSLTLFFFFFLTEDG